MSENEWVGTGNWEAYTQDLLLCPPLLFFLHPLPLVNKLINKSGIPISSTLFFFFGLGGIRLSEHVFFLSVFNFLLYKLCHILGKRCLIKLAAWNSGILAICCLISSPFSQRTTKAEAGQTCNWQRGKILFLLGLS